MCRKRHNILAKPSSYTYYYYASAAKPKKAKRASKLSALQFLERKLDKTAALQKIELELRTKELEIKEIQMEREHEEKTEEGRRGTEKNGSRVHGKESLSCVTSKVVLQVGFES